MEEACSLLVSSGNWQRVGTSDIRLFLDMYVQALLLKMAQANGSVSGDMKRFIAEAPARDVLSIGKALSGEAALNIGHKNRSFAEGTPLLLRCCVAMDDKDGTSSAQQFVAGVSQLLYAAADVDGGLTGNQLSFITGYLGGLRTFLLTRAAGRHASGAQEATRRADVPAQEGKSGAKKQESARPAPETAKKEEPEKTIEELMAELDSLIGLDGVKREVRSLINLIKVRKMREQHDLKVMDMSFHMVFTGNPGTGKTTVARLVAKIYKQLGFLSKGQLIETDRSGLVAGYVGQTAGKVTEVVSSALGGILFIDEAYALARKGMDNDFGREAIDTLVKLMEDNRDDLVVIVAGYTDEMHDFLTSNPGLISRFNKYIDFPDYTDDELMAILAMNAKKQGYTVSDEAN
ncbi:MAG: AAA family ATPase, partial [Clostridia bacterium]|nr:AAA family ATPase [Clostridia bacterium]